MIIDEFHKLYYDSLVWDKETTWMGVRCQKCPLDLWIYQEIIFKTEPDLIIETGTGNGGTTNFLCSILGMINPDKTLVITIDIKWSIPIGTMNDDAYYLQGDSVSEGMVERIRKIIYERLLEKDKTMVILDSDHHYSHVLKELQLYSPFVTIGNYLIVEDTNVNGYPVEPEHGLGPMEAVEEFLKTDQGQKFEIDKGMEKFFMTFNPNGYLRRVG